MNTLEINIHNLFAVYISLHHHFGIRRILAIARDEVANFHWSLNIDNECC